jgi:hypothetical protein
LLVASVGTEESLLPHDSVQGHYKYNCDKNEYRVINYHILYDVFPMDMVSNVILL